MSPKKKEALSVKVRLTGVREVLAGFRGMSKNANDALRDASLTLAQALAVDVAAAGRAEGAQAALVATTVKARRDRVPVIVAGGSKRIGSRRVPAYELLFGSEFGAGQGGRYGLRQFKPHLGSGSYWIFKTVQDAAATARIDREWNAAADAIVRAFGKG